MSRFDSAARQPADVCVPRWRRGAPAAFDFVVAAGLRDIPGTIREASSVVTAYEDLKRSHLNTEQLCIEGGFTFHPMVVEAAGGAWDPAAASLPINASMLMHVQYKGVAGTD